jgi:hypothetical protein
MHIPQTTPVASIAPLSGAEVTLHEFVGLSWHVLMPYSLFGGGLIIYSHVKLLRGQRVLNRQQASDVSTVSKTTKT